MKAKFGAIVVDGRGKAGGHVLSKNRGGSYMRTKVTPSNPRTTAQSSVRSRLTTYAQGFRALTAAQILSWNNAVADYKSTDIFGDIKNPSGINLYTKLNSNLVEGGQSPITAPPLPSNVVIPSTLTLTGAAGTPALSLAFATSPVATGMVWIVRATAQLSPGISASAGRFRNITTIAAAATTPANILAAYNTKFGTLVAGRKVFIQVIGMNITTGQKSASVVTSAVIAA